jgi:pimeloyl-ACP methyl ester carboxylesterase
MSGIIYSASSLYRRYRRGDDPLLSDNIEVLRAQFTSAGGGDGGGWAENEQFEFPLFLPVHCREPHRDLVVILNGLNDSSYRKFFPWAASLAKAGRPAAIFPSAYLMNRRPRDWIGPAASHAAWQRRLQLAPRSATLVNAVLSERIAADPQSLLRDQLQTAADLRLLAAHLGHDAAGYRAFAPGATLHLLGYSLGGYLALALRLQDELFKHSRVVSLCAGASTQSHGREGLSPTSHFILDDHATSTLLQAVRELGTTDIDEPVAKQLIELWTGTTERTRASMKTLAGQITIVSGAGDRVIPTNAIRQNLGRVDCELATGLHEYPFNLATLTGVDLIRVAATAHSIAAQYEHVFYEFVQTVLGALPAERNAA